MGRLGRGKIPRGLVAQPASYHRSSQTRPWQPASLEIVVARSPPLSPDGVDSCNSRDSVRLGEGNLLAAKNNLPADLVLGVSAFLSGVSWQWLRIVRESRGRKRTRRVNGGKLQRRGREETAMLLFWNGGTSRCRRRRGGRGRNCCVRIILIRKRCRVKPPSRDAKAGNRIDGVHPGPRLPAGLGGEVSAGTTTPQQGTSPFSGTCSNNAHPLPYLRVGGADGGYSTSDTVHTLHATNILLKPKRAGSEIEFWVVCPASHYALLLVLHLQHDSQVGRSWKHARSGGARTALVLHHSHTGYTGADNTLKHSPAFRQFDY